MRLLLALTLLTAVVGSATQAFGDWPMPRQGPRRTGVADGEANITEPVAFWRHYLGGAIAPSGALVLDVDSDGEGEIVLVTGGRVAARRAATNDTLWETGQLNVTTLVGTADLDGDGGDELIVRSDRQVYVLRPSDGSVLWEEALGEIGTVGGVRIADFNGDGVEDLLVMECGCCFVNSGEGGFAYRFAGAGASIGAPERMWSVDSIACGGPRANAAVDMRGIGSFDTIWVHATGFELLDGSTGAPVASSADLGVKLHTSRCRGVDALAGPAEELLCVHSDPSAQQTNGHRAFLLRYVTNPQRLELVWEQQIGEIDGQVSIPPSFVRDLDDDGTPEVVLSGKIQADDGWRTEVLDGGTGASLAETPGRAVGTMATGVVLIEGDGALEGWALAEGSKLVKRFALADRASFATVDFDLAVRSVFDTRTLSLDLSGDDLPELVTHDAASAGEVSAYDVTGPNPTLIGTHTLIPGVAAIAGWAFDLEGSGERLAVAHSDGNLHVLTDDFSVLTGNQEFGVRFGGFFSPGTFRKLDATPVVSTSGDGEPLLLVRTSRGSLARLDASEATFAKGPEVLWDRLNTQAAAIVDQGTRVYAVDTGDGDGQKVVSLADTGEMLWSHSLEGKVLATLLPGQLTSDSNDDVFVQWGDPNDAVERSLALDGKSGALLWNGPSFGPGNRQPAGASMADWNGDGLDDPVFQRKATRVLDGLNGAEIVTSPPAWTYNMPILTDVDVDGELEATLHAGFHPASTLDHDLQTPIWEATEGKPTNYGAVIDCGDRPVLVGGSADRPALLKLTTLGGSNLGEVDELVLAAGEAFPDEQSATAAGAKPGVIGSPAVHGNLSGHGRAVAMIGSTDGWLYGVDPCEASLVHALDFEAPVGTVVFGDADGDGLDDVLVSVADGYLYSLEQSRLPAVEQVLDTDPPSGIEDEDVDEIETDDTLYAAWDPVEQAQFYEVAVVRDPIDGGGFVTSPPWRDAGADATATIPGLVLVDDKRYFIAVRAVDDEGHHSPDRLSDGVRVRLSDPVKEPEPPDTPPDPVLLNGRSCVYFCSVDRGRDDGWGWIVAAFVMFAVWRRRSSKHA